MSLAGLHTYNVSKCVKKYDRSSQSPVGYVSDCRYVSDCITRGREFDPGPAPYFHEINSTAILLSSADSRRVAVSKCTKYCP